MVEMVEASVSFDYMVYAGTVVTVEQRFVESGFISDVQWK